MKKTNHYVQWQQLKQLHKATYVGSYKPLVSRVGLCVSAGLWTFLTEPLFGRDFQRRSIKLSRPKQTQPDERAWHNGLHVSKKLSYGILPLSEVECDFIYFLNLHLCLVCMLHMFRHVCAFFFFFFCPEAPLAWCVSSVIPCPWATDQSSRADSLPAGVGLIKEPQTDPGSAIKTHIHSD